MTLQNASGDKNYNQVAFYCTEFITAEDRIAGDQNKGQKREISGLFDKLKKRDDNYYGDVKDEKEEENEEDERSCHRWAEWQREKREREVKVIRPLEREMARLNEELRKVREEMEDVEENEVECMEEKNIIMQVKRDDNKIEDNKCPQEVKGVKDNITVTPNAVDNEICGTSEEEEGVEEINIREEEKQVKRLMTFEEKMKVRLIDCEDDEEWWTSESEVETDNRDEDNYEDEDIEEDEEVENDEEEQRAGEAAKVEQ